ncbi:MAG: N-6 DNA methylase [Candidatus Lokiarchaeota archaeon]|nr:N-6 DNA methylase [Candidatus Lokiarchaeota archaeon]
MSQNSKFKEILEDLKILLEADEILAEDFKAFKNSMKSKEVKHYLEALTEQSKLGVIQSNYRRIDEDILGKAYETFLAEIRKERGIFYTPNYIAHYIVDSAIGRGFNPLVEKFIENLKSETYENCLPILEKLFSIKILDPACGSGSFLIKSLQSIWQQYSKILKVLDEHYKTLSKYNDNLKKPKEIEDKFKLINNLNEILNSNNKRKLISQILLRHIYGNDLDANAINIAKLNLWLEAIKLTPRELQYDRLPTDTNHALPKLTMNLSVGNCLVGLPNKESIKYLKGSCSAELTNLFELREKYILNSDDIEIINEIDTIQSEIREKLGKKFEEFLSKNNLPSTKSLQTIPLSWVLEYWHCFFSKDLSEKSGEERGFEIIVGNPPWGAKLDSVHEYLKFCFPDVVKGQYDSFNTFTYQNIRDLLKSNGTLNYIIPNELCLEEVNEPLREYLLQYRILEITNLGLGIFNDVTKPSMILLIEKSSKEANQIQIFVGLLQDKKYSIKDDIINLKKVIKNTCFNRLQEDFKNNDHFRFDIFSHPIDNEIKEIIRNNNFEPLEAYLSNGRGIDTNKSGTYFICPTCGVLNPPFGVGKAARNEKSCVNEGCEYFFKKTQEEQYETEDIILQLDFKEKEHYAPGYIGEDLQRFYFKRKPRLFRYYGNVIDEPEFYRYSYIPWKNHDLYTEEKLLWRKVSTGNLPQVMVYDGFLVTNQQIYIFKKKNNVQHISVYFYLAVLTSRLIHYLYLKEFGDPDKEVLPHFTQSKIKQFPIPLPDTKSEIYEDLIDNTKLLINQIAEFQEIHLKKFKDILSSKPYSKSDTLLEKINVTFSKIEECIFTFYNITESKSKNRIIEIANANKFRIF